MQKNTSKIGVFCCSIIFSEEFFRFDMTNTVIKYSPVTSSMLCISNSNMVWLFSLRNKFPMKEGLNDLFAINNNLTFFRLRSCEELLEAAKGITEEKRKLPASSSAEILVPHVSGMWGATEIDKRFTSKMIVKAVAEIDELPSGHRQDERCMNRFLSNSKLDEMVDPNIIPICEIIPCSVPLIDYLRVH